jgi:HAMP domain-containing protein
MKPLKKILKWTGIVLGALVAIGLVANAVFVWITDTRLERQLVAIRAAGDPLTLADLAPKPIPPEKNANTYLRRAQPDVDAIEYAVGRLREERKEEENALSMYLREEWPTAGTRRKVTKAVNAIFALHPKAIPLLQQAVDCPDYSAQLNYTVSPAVFVEQSIPIVQQFHNDAAILWYRARVLMFEGNCDEAAKMALAGLKLARHAHRNPCAIGDLVATDLRGIAVSITNDAL